MKKNLLNNIGLVIIISIIPMLVVAQSMSTSTDTTGTSTATSTATSTVTTTPTSTDGSATTSTSTATTSSGAVVTSAMPLICERILGDLFFGLEGEEVSALQQFLTEQGFTVSVVGRFGPRTREAVQQFQMQHGIEPTGFVGPKTRAVIINMKCNGSFEGKALLNQNMRKLWEDHITWTRLYIVEAVGGNASTSASTTAARLLKNQEDIGNAIKPFYGEAAGNQLTALLKTHIQGAVDIINAAKNNNQSALDTAKQMWYDNANQIATFLSQANPTNWPQTEMQQHMKDHLDLTLDEAVQQLQGNFQASVDDYDKVHTQILQLADVLTKGLVAQFPERF